MSIRGSGHDEPGKGSPGEEVVKRGKTQLSVRTECLVVVKLVPSDICTEAEAVPAMLVGHHIPHRDRVGVLVRAGVRGRAESRDSRYHEIREIPILIQIELSPDVTLVSASVSPKPRTDATLDRGSATQTPATTGGLSRTCEL